MQFEEAVSSYFDADASEGVHYECMQTIRQNCGSDLLPMLLHPLVKAGLVAEQEKIRYRAALLLAELVELHESNWEPLALHSLLLFFCSRVSDYPSVVPCLKGVKSLLERSSKWISRANIELVFTSLFKEIPVQSVAQSIRQRFFELMNAMLSDSYIVQASQGVGPGVVKGCVLAVSGEKDPRCLLLSFKLMGKLFEHYSTHIADDIVSDLFETIACYFPITFSPPADDPYGITAELLTAALQDCLCSTVLFLPHLVPFLLDQLSSDAMTAGKLQALESLVKVAKTHGISPLAFILRDLANVLYSLVVSASTESQLHNKALWTMSELSRIIATEKSTMNSHWGDFIETIVVLILDSLSDDIEGVKATSAMKVAKTLASSLFLTLSYVFSKLLPILTVKFDHVVHSVTSGLNSFVSRESPEVLVPAHTPVLYIVQLLECIDVRVSFSSEQRSASFATDCLNILSTIETILRPRPLLGASVSELDLSFLPQKTLLLLTSLIECSKCLLIRANFFPMSNELTSRFINRLIVISIFGSKGLFELTDSSCRIIPDRRRATAVLPLTARNAVAGLANSANIDAVVEFISNTLRSLVAALDSNSTSVAEEDIKSALSLLSTLCRGRSDYREPVIRRVTNLITSLIKGNSSSSGNRALILGQTIELYDDLFEGFTRSEGDKEAISLCCFGATPPVNVGSTDSPIILLLSSINMDANRQPSLVAPICKLLRRTLNLLHGEQLEVFAQYLTSLLPRDNFSGAKLQEFDLQLCLTIFECIPVNSSILTGDNDNNFLRYMCAYFDGLVHGSDSHAGETTEISSQIIAVLVNKLPQDICWEALPSLIDLYSKGVTYNNTVSVSDAGTSKVRLLLRVCRGLSMRQDIAINAESIERLRSYTHLQDLDATWQSLFTSILLKALQTMSVVALNLGVLFQEANDAPLADQSRCNSTLMWKQKLWYKVWSRQKESLQGLTAESPGYGNVLISLCTLIGQGSTPSILSGLRDESAQIIVKALVHSSKSNDGMDPSYYSSLRYRALEALNALLDSDLSSISSHLSTIVPALLHVALLDEKPTKRVGALDALSKITTLPYSNIFPLKTQVIKVLGKVVDDPKRAIRINAARVRNEWIALTATSY